MRPSLATKLAASSRARSTTLSSPEVLPEEAEEPAKLEAMAGAESASYAQQIRGFRIIVGIPQG